MRKKIYFLVISSICLILFFLGIGLNKQKSESLADLKNADEHEMRSGAFDAMQFFSTMASYPSSDVPDGGYFDGYKQIQYNFPKNKSQVFNGTWAPLGPNNLGGRTLCIAFDPGDTAKIWLGSASGGLWKSTTGGIGLNAWTYVPLGFPVLGVSSIAIEPNNNQVMYIGTGETYSNGTTLNGLVDRTTRGTVGMGILKTTDGGLTWTPSLNWTYQQKKGIWDIVINPLNPSVVYAATTDGIYKTTDAGVTWNNVLNVPMAMDLLMVKNDTSVLFAGIGNLSSPNKGLYKTNNSGFTWNILTNGLPPNTHDGRIIISAYENNNNILMCEICNAFSTVGIYRSNDQGATWAPMSPSIEICSYQGWYSKGLLIKPDDSSQVLIGGVQLFHSSSSGNNFFQVSNINQVSDYMHADVHDVVANPLSPEKVYILTDGGLFRSDDFGASFTESTDGYVTSQFYIGSVSYSDSTLALGGAQDNYTQRYYGNPYWYPVVGGDGSYNAIDPTDDYNQLCSYQYLNILKSTDQGNNFFQVVNTNASATSINSVAFIAPIVMAPSDPNIVYAGGDSLIVSYDGGDVWTQFGISPVFHGNPILSIGVSYTFTDSLYLATVPGNGYPMHIFRSGNGGATLTDITTPNLPDRYPRRITVNPVNSSEAYLVLSGFGTGHLFKTTDAGNSWTDISGSLPDVPFHCLAIDPLIPSHLFAGCDYGIFASPDGGLTWTPFNEGLNEAVMVFDIVVSPVDRSLRAYTHGNGVYKRSFNDFNTAIGDHQTAWNIPMQIIPNPVSKNAFCKFESPVSGEAEITIYSLQGILMNKKSQYIKSGRNETGLSAGAFDSGVYLVSIKVKGQVFSKRFIKL